MNYHWLGPTLGEMSDILRLEEGWDTYEAPKIAPLCVKAALDFLFDAMSDDVSAPAVVPTSCGGVQVEWSANNIKLEVEFYPNGKVGCLYETEEWGDVTNLAALRPLVRKLVGAKEGPNAQTKELT